MEQGSAHSCFLGPCNFQDCAESWEGCVATSVSRRVGLNWPKVAVKLRPKVAVSWAVLAANNLSG